MTRGEHSTNDAPSGSIASNGPTGDGNRSIVVKDNAPSSSFSRHEAPVQRERDREKYDRRRDDRGPPRDRGGGGYHGNGNGNYNRRGGGGGGGGGGYRGNNRGPPRDRPPPRRGIYFRSYAEEQTWVETRRKARLARPSLFDVEPTSEQVAMEELQKAALASHGPNPNVFLRPEERVGASMSAGVPGVSSMSMSMQPQQTRHARRLYIGQLADDLSEGGVHDFFKDCITRAMGDDSSNSSDDPILSVYINKERHFAFIEFKSMDITTACLSLNGINMLNRGKIIIKRPNDYNPSNAPAASAELLRKFDVSKLGIISSIVADSPNKIFIGGLPYHLKDDQVIELLSAFGKLKAFHLVKSDAHAATTKGYCFVEYADEGVTEVAIMGLNGMDMGGGKVLSAKIASKRREGEGAEIGTAAIGGALAVTPIVPSGDMIASGGVGRGMSMGSNMIMGGGVSSAPPIMNFVDGVDVEALVDVAMGNADMSVINARVNSGVHGNDTSATPAPESNALDIANAALQAVYGTSAQSGSGSAGNGSAPTPTSSKTRIVVLNNMVTEEDFISREDYEGLKDEVKEECQKFGSLISMVIPHPEVRCI